MSAILLYMPHRDPAPWIAGLRAALPDTDIRVWPDIGHAADVDFALAWQPPPGLLAGLPNLRAVSSLGHGAEHLLPAGVTPPHVRILRIVDTELTAGMSEYVIAHVLRVHRELDVLAANQRAARWDWRLPPRTADTVVGILGFGALGQDAARKLKGIGFQVRGWSRSAKDEPGVETFAGRDALPVFLAPCRHLVCLLPLTPETTGLIDARLLSYLPRGAHLLNAGRGPQVVEADLLAALDSGQIGHATLDVFVTEPLPAAHLFWLHPNVTVTPHNAAVSNPQSIVAQVADNVRRLRSGEAPRNEVNRARGY